MKKVVVYQFAKLFAGTFANYLRQRADVSSIRVSYDCDVYDYDVDDDDYDLLFY